MYYGTNVMCKSTPWKHVYPDNAPDICDAFPEPYEHFRVSCSRHMYSEPTLGDSWIPESVPGLAIVIYFWRQFTK